MHLAICLFASISAQAQKAPVQKSGPINAIGRGLKGVFTPNIDSEAAKPAASRREREEATEECIPGVCHKTVVVHPVRKTYYVTGATRELTFGDPTPKVTETTVEVPQTHHIHYKYAPLVTIEDPKPEEVHTETTIEVPRTHTIRYTYGPVVTIEEPRPAPLHTTEIVPVPRTHTVVYEATPVVEAYCPQSIGVVTIGVVETVWTRNVCPHDGGTMKRCGCKKVH